MVVRISVEKGIPIPPRQHGPRGGEKRRWPFQAMAPFDSFFLATNYPERESRLAYVAAKRVGIRIAIRNCEGGVRVWRLPDETRPSRGSGESGSDDSGSLD